MTRPERLMLLDTASLYFRAFFGVPETVTAPDGTPVNAVRGLLDFVARLVTDRRPTHLVACTDEDWRPAFRVAAIPSYKAHRVAPAAAPELNGETVPDTLAPQVPVIFELLDVLGIARVGVPGYEADDVIGSLVASATLPVDVVTGDRDLFQLVDDARRVRILYTAAKGVGRHEVVDEAAVHARYAIPGRAYGDYAVLRGDPSDGLPGVRGIGDKTAAQLIRQYGSLAALVEALDAGDPRLPSAAGRKLAAARDYLQVAPAVVRVATGLDVPVYDDRLPAAPRDPQRLVELVDRWGVESSVGRVLTALATAGRS